MSEQLIEILLIEDNPGDVLLTREALRDGRFKTNLNVVGDGAAAIEFLEQKGAYANAPRPDMILLDLNLPRLSGLEVLDRIKGHQQWRVIPIIMLTTSESAQDIYDAYERHVNCYITKPLSFDPFMVVVRRIEEFWLSTARLPVQAPGLQ